MNKSLKCHLMHYRTKFNVFLVTNSNSSNSYSFSQTPRRIRKKNFHVLLKYTLSTLKKSSIMNRSTWEMFSMIKRVIFQLKNRIVKSANISDSPTAQGVVGQKYFSAGPTKEPGGANGKHRCSYQDEAIPGRLPFRGPWQIFSAGLLHSSFLLATSLLQNEEVINLSQATKNDLLFEW